MAYTVTTLPASSITDVAASISGSVTATGVAGAIWGLFIWGTGGSLVNSTPETEVGLGTNTFSFRLESLTPGTLYSFAAVSRRYDPPGDTLVETITGTTLTFTTGGGGGGGDQILLVL